MDSLDKKKGKPTRPHPDALKVRFLSPFHLVITFIADEDGESVFRIQRGDLTTYCCQRMLAIEGEGLIVGGKRISIYKVTALKEKRTRLSGPATGLR